MGLFLALVLSLLPADCFSVVAQEKTALRDHLVRARVVQVIDGDTFMVAFAGTTSARVRLIGVDTPESVHPTRGAEPYGQAAAAFTGELLAPGTDVFLEFDVEVADRNGRLLAYAYLADGRMVNEVLLSEGYAQLYTLPPNVRHVERFRAAQRTAREHGRGLWGDPAGPAGRAGGHEGGEGAGRVEAAAPGESGGTQGSNEPDAFSPRLLIASVELDTERVEVWNGTDTPADLTGWKLRSVRGGQEYAFPEGFVLAPRAVVAVTSGRAFEHDPPASLAWTRQEVWANQGDPAELLDPEGRAVSTFP